MLEADQLRLIVTRPGFAYACQDEKCENLRMPAVTVSVALATYNGEAFLQQQLESIAGQTHLPAEMVVTDDASSDGTLQILQRFAADAPFPVHIHKNPVRLGYRDNFMRALSLCSAPLVALCDQDDIWDERKLSVAVKAFDGGDVLLFFHAAKLIDRNGRAIGSGNIFDALPVNPPQTAHSLFSPFGFSMVIDRRLLNFSDLWPRSIDSSESQNTMAHDQWLYFLSGIFGVIIYCDMELTYYRQHGNNTYGSPTKTFGYRMRRLFRFLVNHGDRYASLAKAAHRRAQILNLCQDRLDGSWAARAMSGASACTRLADRLQKRARLYSRAGLIERVRLVLELVCGGAYTNDGGFGLGREVLAKAMVLGILLQRFLLKPPASGTPAQPVTS